MHTAYIYMDDSLITSILGTVVIVVVVYGGRFLPFPAPGDNPPQGHLFQGHLGHRLAKSDRQADQNGIGFKGTKKLNNP